MEDAITQFLIALTSVLVGVGGKYAYDQQRSGKSGGGLREKVESLEARLLSFEDKMGDISISLGRFSTKLDQLLHHHEQIQAEYRDMAKDMREVDGLQTDAIRKLGERMSFMEGRQG